MREWRPTSAYQRAIAAGVILLLVGVVTGGRAALVLAVPFIAYVLVAGLPPRAVPHGRTHTQDVTLTVDIDDVPGDAAVAIAWPQEADVSPHGPLSRVDAAFDAHTVDLVSSAYGTHHLPPVGLAISTPEGAWRIATDVGVPPLVCLPALRSPADARFARPQAGDLLSTSRLEGGDGAIARIRDYEDGDDPRRVNWRVFARSGELATTVYTTETSHPTLVLTDTRWNAPGWPSALDQTIQAAWWTTSSCLARGDSVGLHDLGGRLRPIPIGRRGVLDRLRDDVRDMSRDFVSSRALGTPPRITRGTSVVVCSPLLSEEVVRLIGALARRGVRVTIIDTGARPGDTERLSPADAARRAIRDGMASGLAERVPVWTWDPTQGRPLPREAR